MKKSFMFLILMVCASLLIAQDPKKKTDAAPQKEKAVEAKQAEPAPSPESIAKGKEAIKKAIEALGGKALLEVKDIVQVSSLTINSPQGEMQIEATTTIALPNRMAQTMSTQYGDMKTGYDGTTGWMAGPNGVQDIPDAQIGEVKKQLGGNIYTFLQHYDQVDYLVQYLSEEKAADKSAHVVLVKYVPSDFAMKLYIETKSNLIVKRVGQRSMGMGAAEVEDTYSDYRAVNGVQIPFKIVSQTNGNKFADITMTSVKINSGVKDDVFKKPAE